MIDIAVMVILLCYSVSSLTVVLIVVGAVLYPLVSLLDQVMHQVLLVLCGPRLSRDSGRGRKATGLTVAREGRIRPYSWQ